MTVRCAFVPHPHRRSSPDSAWPLRRADGTAFYEPARRIEVAKPSRREAARPQARAGFGEADAPNSILLPEK